MGKGQLAIFHCIVCVLLAAWFLPNYNYKEMQFVAQSCPWLTSLHLFSIFVVVFKPMLGENYVQI